AETAGVAVASPPGDGTSLVARVGTVDHTARRHVAGEVARGDGGADARVAADADSLREVGPLAHQRQPAREMLGAGLVGNSVLAEAQLGARADPGFLVDDHTIHFRALLDLHVVLHDDAVTHHRAHRHSACGSPSRDRRPISTRFTKTIRWSSPPISWSG